MKIRAVGAELFRADGWTGTCDEVNVVSFGNLAKAPEESKVAF